MRISKISKLIFLLPLCLLAYGGGGCTFCSAFAPIVIPQRKLFSSSSSYLPAEKSKNKLLPGLETLQTKASEFAASSLNELSGGSNKLATTTRPPLKASPPAPFDPTNPEALIAITKSFVATDFGIQSSQLPNYSTAPKKKDVTAAKITSSSNTFFDSSISQVIAEAEAALAAVESSALSTTTTPNSEEKPILPFYSSSLLSDESFIWVSGNNINDGRTGILNKREYLAAGRYFDLRSSFPDLEYRAHDFRVLIDEERGYSNGRIGGGSNGEITVRFTTLTTGTFRGSPLKLRSKIIPPNGKKMNCPPTAVSITFAAAGPEKGKIVKLVTDMVMDRQIGNTQGLSGVAGAAAIAGVEPNAFVTEPPLVALGRLFNGPAKNFDERYGEVYMPPFPETVMIQLAKGVVAANFGLDDPDLLANEFSYIEPSMDLTKIKYLERFSEYGIREAVKDLDYNIENYRVDPYNPYRIWVDTRAKGTRTGAIGDKTLKVTAADYEAAPEAMSFSFDDDGYCTRITSAAVLDPLLGNTGGLGGVNGLLYATGTPQNALMTRSLNSFFTRATKSLFTKVGLADGADSFRMSDGRVIGGLSLDTDGVKVSLPSKPDTASDSSPKPPSPRAVVEPKAAIPFFASSFIEKPAQPNAAVTKQTQVAQIIKEPVTSDPPAREKAPIDANPTDPVTDAFSAAFGITDAKVIATSGKSDKTSIGKSQQLREKARQARLEAAEAKERAASLEAVAVAKKKKELEEKLEEQQRKQQRMEEENAMALEAKQMETQRIKKLVEEVEERRTNDAAKIISDKTKIDAQSKRAMFSFFSYPSSSKASLKGKEASRSKILPPPKRSPTLNLFGNLPETSKSVSSAPLIKPKLQYPKRSSTVNIFPSANNAFFSTTKNKSASTVSPPKRSPTLSAMGIGAPPKQIPKVASSKKSPKQKLSAEKKAPAPKQPSEAARSPAISLFGIGTSEVSSEKSKLVNTSPTFSLFGVGGSKTSPSKSSSSMNERSKSTSSTVKGSANAFSFFGDGNRVTTKTATKAISTESKEASKPNESVPKKLKASKGGSSSVLFGGFFGSSSGEGGIKKEEEQSINKNKESNSKIAPKGVPVLKGWKVNANNEIQGKIYLSASFREGQTITTSPAKGRLESGNVVQTQSGSKYFLE